MATRSGKANTVQSMRGVVSPRVLQFRNAGLASVWEWSDAATDGPVGTTIACNTDCAIDVTAAVSRAADFTLTVNCAFVKSVDTGIATTSAICISHDECLFIYEVWAFAKDCDMQTITLNAREAAFDEHIGVTNALVMGFGIDAEVRSLLSKQMDISLRLRALRTIHGDVLISIPDPVLLTADTLVAVSGAMRTEGDQGIAVTGSTQRLAYCLQHVCGATVRRADVRIVVGERIGLKADQAWWVSGVSVADCDIRAVIACQTALGADVEIRTTMRLAPDADTYQTVFAVIIREDHIIGT